MKGPFSLQTRRDFIRTGVLGGALSWTVPAFLSNTFSALHAEAADAATQTATGRDSTILVVLQMAGGNDGLNTVVPYASDHYYKARSKIGLPANSLLKINDQIGLHPSLAGFKDLYDAGHLSIIQGAGYPNPNRSHFRSTEIWQTASDSEQVERYGWLGRYFDNACAGADPAVGVAVGRQMPQAFSARAPTGICLNDPQNYRFMAGRRTAGGSMNADEKSFRELNDAPSEEMENSGATIGAISGPSAHHGSVMDFLQRTAMDAELSSDKILAITKKTRNQAEYPVTPLARSLKLVAQLIAGGLPTRVYYISQGGYDTHTNQTGQQERLLSELGGSVKAFVEDLKAQGNLPRVLVMTFSEFGRRVAENANGGTDHGAAAPMFVIGGKVKAGLHGQYPSLAPGDLFNGDLQFKVDFRSVYAGLLEEWLKTKSEPILGRKFATLPLA
ncbi:MAG TPA: DUF1501 domain-containing protein [Verrucomicrobiae bacterium]|jgi:uncharacterized protein (DUF1501 family)